MTKAFICGVSSITLTDDERAYLRVHQPWGLILFKRNVRSPDQISALTKEFREIVGRADAPVLIDQEGGRVQRMGPPVWPKYPPAARFNALSVSTQRKAELVRLSSHLMGLDSLQAQCAEP
jgi:beta-N-acetylhexosaminidase